MTQCVFELSLLQVKEAKVTEARINEARELYRPAAAQASLLYFIMNDLNTILPMYQFSLKVACLLTCHVSTPSETPLYTHFSVLPLLLPFAPCVLCSLLCFYCVC